MRPSVPIQLISKLPFGRRSALRLWNRVLMHFAPRRTVTTYFGADMKCDVRDMIQGTITHFGAWEPRVSRTFERLVDPGDTVVDVGANVGYYSLLFSGLVGPSGRVVAVEALPKLAAVVACHAEKNGRSNIRIVNLAASDRPGMVKLYEAPGTNIGMTTTRSERGFPATSEIQALPLTQILTADEMSKVTLIKIDIEGAEVPVITDILDNFDRFSLRPSIEVEASIVENPEWEALFQRFHSLGFTAYDLHNDYDWLGMLRPINVPPTILTRVPKEQTDVLFTFRKL